MAIKYNPYNWEIRPRKESDSLNINLKPIKIEINVDDEEIERVVVKALKNLGKYDSK